MCGICGELSFGAPVQREALQCMADSLSHRGPDDEGLFAEGPIGLGHRRLSIIDLSEAGRNPIWTADGSLAIVFNGEVYNYRELRSELLALGYGFQTATDTEVVLNAIHCWGIEAALRRFIGMFAFAVWNVAKRELLLARDRAGVKPLFYARTDRSLLFGSELKALYAHPAYRKKIDAKGLSQFFVLGYTLGASTVLSGTHRVPAGHYVRIAQDGTLGVHRYWSIDEIRRGSFSGSFEQAVDELVALSTSAFSYRLVSDVPVAVFLSGGIDSSFLSAILKKRLDADLLHITIGFRDARYDEAPAATEIARQLGVRHHVRYIDAPDAAEALKRFAEIYDEPFGDSSGIPTAILSSVAREHAKVVLSADGGDEQFCGYESYPAYAKRFGQMAAIPLFLRRLATSAGSALPYERVLSWYTAAQGSGRRNPRLISTVEKALALAGRHTRADLLQVMNEKGWSAASVGTLLGRPSDDTFADSVLARDAAGHANGADIIDAMMRVDYKAFLGDDVLTKVDRASMAASLECRDPFLDHRIAEFAFGLPLEYLYGAGEQKRILKHVLRRWLTEDVLTARKRGFVIPLYEWMRGPWRPLVQEYLSPERVRAVGVLDDAVVSSEVSRFYRYEGVGAEKVQLMLNFQMWAERWYLR